jgi:signal transduction histidine kinase
MPHDLAATRRARKGLRSAVSSPDVRPPEPATEPAVVAPVIGDRVVADVRHEIGNYFHKLYYWADFLNESRSGRAGDVTATQMLEDTIHGLEALLKATLEYVRPMAAAPIRMHAREVADGIVRQLAIAAVVDGALSPERTLLVDPGRLSQLVAALVRRLETTTDATRELAVRVMLESRDGGDVLALRVAADGSGTAHPTLAEVEWATAENVARVIGGELSVHDGGTAFVLTLPLRS